VGSYRHKYCLQQTVCRVCGQLQTQVLSSADCLWSWWEAADTSVVFTWLSVRLVCSWTLRIIKLWNYLLLQLHMPPTLTLKTVYWHKILFLSPMIYGIKFIAFLIIIHRISFMTEIRFVCWVVELTCVHTCSLTSYENAELLSISNTTSAFRGCYIIQEIRHIFRQQLPSSGECVSNRRLCCSNVCSFYKWK
jgi:hypothetical protein